MRARRQRSGPSELTSLLDVLFILLFAALVQASGLVAKAKEAPTRPAQPPPARPSPPQEPVPRPRAITPDEATLRRQAAEALVTESGRSGLITARISAEGRITHLTLRRGGAARELAVDLPLVERVPDPDVALSYLGRRIPDMRACTAIRRALGDRDLGGALVMLRPTKPLAELPVALVDGLREDQRRCYPEEKGLAVLLDGLTTRDEETP